MGYGVVGLCMAAPKYLNNSQTENQNNGFNEIGNWNCEYCEVCDLKAGIKKNYKFQNIVGIFIVTFYICKNQFKLKTFADSNRFPFPCFSSFHLYFSRINTSQKHFFTFSFRADFRVLQADFMYL